MKTFKTKTRLRSIYTKDKQNTTIYTGVSRYYSNKVRLCVLNTKRKTNDCSTFLQKHINDTYSMFGISNLHREK